MTTNLVSIQDFAKRDGKGTSREWVKSFSEQKFLKGALKKPWSGNVNENFPTAVARIDFGRWIADCPFCNGACMVDPDDDFFYCLHCAGNGTGDAGKVRFPDEIENIESAVLERPVITSGVFNSKADEALNSIPALLPRNWMPGQTADDLKRQHEQSVAVALNDLEEREHNG